jgi:hypothetical protein
VPAHAVGDDIKVVLLEHYEGIFVVLPLETDIAHTSCDCPHQIDQSSRTATEIGSLATARGVKHAKRSTSFRGRKPTVCSSFFGEVAHTGMEEKEEDLIPP